MVMEAVANVVEPAPSARQWTVSAHLDTNAGTRITIFATFAQQARAHGVVWGVSCSDDETYRCAAALDADAAADCLHRIQSAQWSKDARLDRALGELIGRGRIPAPNELCGGRTRVRDAGDEGCLAVELGSNRLRTDMRGHHHVAFSSARAGIACSLVFVPDATGRCRVTGTLARADRETLIVEGFGRGPVEAGGALDRLLAALRLDVHFTDGSDLFIDGPIARWSEADRTLELRSLEVVPLATWQSTRTFCEYPVRLAVRARELDLELEVAATFADQELVSLAFAPCTWAGRVDVRGRIAGREVRGVGLLVTPPREQHRDLESFFRAVGRVVRASVARELPHDLDRASADNLFAGATMPHTLDGVDLSQLSRTLIKPIRDIVDRGGKAWRSYAAIACCDLVGGDSRRFVDWLAMPELMHVGSLIVDDIQDRSAIRRGGPSAHVLHGEPLAINAGTAAYFLTQRTLVASEHLSKDERLAVYDLYFEALRAGHAGQALDLDGCDTLLAAAVKSGDATALERHVLAVHRLKTAIPASCLARMGAVAGGGSDEQIAALGRFFEALGLAFQIVDDVLGLRGFEAALKSRGEDIANGKVTLPVAKALGILGASDREWLAATLQSKPTDDATIARATSLLEVCGAIDRCAREANQLVEDAWVLLDPLVEDSYAKVMLRAFGWFVLERHY